MKRRLRCLPVVAALLVFASFPANSAEQSEIQEEPTVESQTEDRWLVILGVYKQFNEAKADALRFAKLSGVPFSMRDMVFDKAGLHFPKNFEDEVYAGEYMLRRHNEGQINDRDVPEFLSIEKSGAYEGLKPGFYIIVGAIESSKKAALSTEQRFAAVTKSAYTKKTRIYMGCMH